MNLLAGATSALRGGRFEQARAACLNVLADDPANPHAWHLLGGVLLQLADFAGAQEAFLKALALRDDPLFHLNLSRALRAQKRLDACEKALRRAIELAPAAVEMRHELADVLYRAGRFEAAEGELRKAIRLSPPFAQAWFLLGHVLGRRGRVRESEQCHRKALELGLATAQSCQGLAVALHRLRRWDEAEAMFRKALALQSDFAAALNGIGTSQRERGQFHEAESAFRRAVELEPDNFWALNNLGIVLADMGRREESEAVVRRALALRPESGDLQHDADVLLNMGMLLLSMGRMQEGWPYYEARHKPDLFDGSIRSPGYAFPQWAGEPLEGKSLIVWSEQGHGDTLQVVRYVPMLKQLGVSKLTWVCGEPLRELMAAVPGIDQVTTRDTAAQPHDYWCYAMSLPMRMGTTLETIPAQLPYLRADPNKVRQWRDRIPTTGIKVGLAWKGSASHINDARRSLAGLADLAPLWSIPGITFVSLQKGAGEDQAVNPPPGQTIVALGHLLQDFSDTAAVIDQLDLVIGVDTSVIHLAGAMGKPTWVMLPSLGVDWRWLIGRDDSPWYPGTMRLWRNDDQRIWAPLVERVRAALEQFANDRAATSMKPVPAIASPVAEEFKAAFAAHQAGRVDEAKAGYERVLQADPSHADAWHLLGGVMLREKRYAEAEQHMRKALSLREDPVFLNNLGQMLHSLRRVADARAVFHRTLEIDPHNADAHHLLAVLLLQTGKVDEALAALRASIDSQADNPSTHRLLGHLLEHCGRFDESEAALRKAESLDPDSLDTQLYLGNTLNNAGKLPEAEAAYRRAIALRDDSAPAHHGLGLVLQKLGRMDEACASFSRAIEIRPDFGAAINGLGIVFLHRGKFQEAEAAFRRALELSPNDFWAHNNLGVLLQHTERREEAQERFAKAMSIKPGPDQRLNVAMLHLGDGRFSEGWELYEARFEARADFKTGKPDLPFPMWQGEPLNGKKLLVWPEQGFGDIIQMARYAPMLRSLGLARLTWACGKSLRPLLLQLPEIDEVVDPKAAQASHDYWCYAMSLPLRLGTELETIPAKLPYLQAPPDRIAPWKSRLPKKGVRVGLVWKGSKVHKNDQNRSLPGLAALASLWTVPGVSFVSLQKGAGEDEALSPPEGQPITALGKLLRDFGDTAAVIAGLDLVIGVDTSVIHLSGAMGKPTWVMLPSFGADWRWLVDREDSPWYPGVMRVFRDKRARDWAPLIARVRSELEQFVRSKKRPPPFVLTPVGAASAIASIDSEEVTPEVPLFKLVITSAITTPAPVPAPTTAEEVVRLGNEGSRLRKLGKTVEAEAAYRRALDLDPQHVEIAFSMANLLRAQGRHIEAEAFYRQVIRLAPQLAKAHNNLAVLLRAMGRSDEAQASYRKAIETAPDYAEGHANLGNLLVALGREDEAEQSYERAIQVRPGFAAAHNGLGALYIRQKLWPQAEASIRRALELQPDHADAWNNLGTVLQESRRLAESEMAYSRALELKPDFADASNNLGTVMQRAGRIDDAGQAYKRAMELKPNDPSYANNFATVLMDWKNWAEAEAAYTRAIALKPDYADAHSNLGALLLQVNRVDEAQASFRRALQVQPDLPEARLNLGVLLLGQGRFEEGWEHYEYRHSNLLKNAVMAQEKLPGREWKGEPLEGKTFLIWPEQGFGDSIQFARYAKQLKALGVKHLTLVCHQPLKALLETLEDVDTVISDLREVGEYDYGAYVLSLPMRFATNGANIPAALPYLQADPDRVAKWKPRLPVAARRIGLVWKGAKGHRNDKARSLPSLASLAPLWAAADTAFVSLQKGQGEDEALNPPAGQPITALGSEVQDFADTAAIISQLDLVICVDTSIAHLAGAMGKHTWVLLPSIGTDWRWLTERTDSPWYPGVMRLVRQSTPGDWTTAIQEVADALKSVVASKPRKTGRKRRGE
ncbi:tetratricopeptide repeat protein [Caenimonas sp. SL110]|uniref:tetratricopeptide repeat protein n=1 Tax=Caenimonas sp. SL110 TaxID=1450524 RepID=UPI00069DD109|nr:tetratricopeptide repeat protein [Caenimonas sp. SL110]